MKCLLVFALLCAVSHGLMMGGMGVTGSMGGMVGMGCMGGMGGMGCMANMGIERLVRDQVRAMLLEDPSLTEAECEARCDALFLLDIVSEDETLTDTACATECRTYVHSVHVMTVQTTKVTETTEPAEEPEPTEPTEAL